MELWVKSLLLKEIVTFSFQIPLWLYYSFGQRTVSVLEQEIHAATHNSRLEKRQKFFWKNNWTSLDRPWKLSSSRTPSLWLLILRTLSRKTAVPLPFLNFNFNLPEQRLCFLLNSSKLSSQKLTHTFRYQETQNPWRGADTGQSLRPEDSANYAGPLVSKERNES